ncbi:hypothetical protein [Micromonospora pisi]|uniref:hypothetical protein n=1 Tax=Micromonospora pisi TaxID=589240 RepID=UPI0011C40884|nr:hypothetical protein [Micromonospora pisi]
MPVTETKITELVRESRPGGKYEDDPFVGPDSYLGNAPWWAKGRGRTVTAWFKRHMPPPVVDAEAVAAERQLELADVLWLEDVAALGGVQEKTITDHLYQSQEEVGGKRGAAKKRGKWADDPFPAPEEKRAGRRVYWKAERRDEILAWFGRHPRRQVGDGIGGPSGITRAEAQGLQPPKPPKPPKPPVNASPREYLDWAAGHALDIYLAGDTARAIDSFAADLVQHEGTTHIVEDPEFRSAMADAAAKGWEAFKAAMSGWPLRKPSGRSSKPRVKS